MPTQKSVVSPTTATSVQPLAVDLNEACRLLSISRASMYRLLQRRLIHPSRGLRQMRFPIWELERYLTETSASVNL